MFGVSNDVIRVGVSMRDVIDIVAARGYFPDATPERIWQRRLEKIAAGEPFQQRQPCAMDAATSCTITRWRMAAGSRCART